MVAPDGAPTETAMMREVIYDAQNSDKSEGGKTTEKDSKGKIGSDDDHAPATADR
jgi:hypothetical protein